MMKDPESRKNLKEHDTQSLHKAILFLLQLRDTEKLYSWTTL